MKEFVPAPPAIVRNDYKSIRELFTQNVVPSYGRFELVLSHGAGSYVFDVAGKRYLDLGGGIAVNCLGNAHPAITRIPSGAASGRTFRSKKARTPMN